MAPVETLSHDLAELCGAIGPRVTGSASSEASIAWAVRRLREAGLGKVAPEEVPLPARWLPGREEASCTAPEAFTLRVAQVPLSPACAAPLEAPLVAVEAGAPLPEDARGAIVLLLRSHDASGREPSTPGEVRALAAEAARAGAAALLLESRRTGAARERLHPGGTGPLPLPAAVAPRPDAERLARLAARSPVRVRLVLEGRDAGPGTSANVVAEVPGRDDAAAAVLLGTHLDSWDLGTGALDSGVNVVTLLAAVRALAAAPGRPQAPVRLVLFTGEEQDRLGSRSYVERHRAELGSLTGIVLLDLGTGRIQGFHVNGRRDLEERLLAALSRFEPDRAFLTTRRPYLGSDDLPFVEAGFAAAVADQDAVPGTEAMHTEDDVVARVDLAAARENAALVARLARELAARPAAAR